MTWEVSDLRGREVLDSRGRPTVEARCALAGGGRGRASVPSGASTGSAEALDRRDGGRRYGGLGCRAAAASVGGEIRDALAGRAWDQAGLDAALVELDGTPSRGRLGANAILGASLAFARACADERGVPLWRHLADVAGEEPTALPRPTINLLSGGKHAGGQVEVQDVLVVPASARTVDEALATTYAVYAAAAELARERYGARPLTADEGGLAPEVPDAEAMLELAVAAIERAGLAPGADVALAVDVAASHFREGEGYRVGNALLSTRAMVERVAGWLDSYPLVSVEDGLAEDDWDGWPALRARLGGRALVLGDDLLCTQAALVARAVEAGAADALLLKVNQVGTLSEADRARRLARESGWAVTVSARSGETEDDWLADLAVGWSGDQLKVGSITQSERLAKWNRLLEIEADTGLPLVAWP